MAKKLIWRVQGIAAKVTQEELLSCFDESENGRIEIKTFCPSVDDPENYLTATIEYQHQPHEMDHTPLLKMEFQDELHIERDFIGFTPLFSPPPGAHEAEYVAACGLSDETRS